MDILKREEVATVREMLDRIGMKDLETAHGDHLVDARPSKVPVNPDGRIYYYAGTGAVLYSWARVACYEHDHPDRFFRMRDKIAVVVRRTDDGDVKLGTAWTA
jgi:hypothetical protein